MSAPYSGKQFTITQPDGTKLWVKGWGNQDYAVFECLNGYTVVKDPKTGFYVYADLSPDGQELTPTELQPRVSPTKPKDVGLASGLRVQPEAARAIAVQSSSQSIGKSRWRERRDEFKSDRRSVAEMATQGIAASAPTRETVGDYVGLCLLLQFPDERGIITQAQVDAFCNQPGYNEFGNHGSVYDYFYDISGGKLRYTNIVAPYYTAKQPLSYYTDASVSQGIRAEELIKEALDYFQAQGFDFSSLTTDDGDYVYAVNAYYAGTRTNNWAEGLWPHQGWFSTPYPLNKDKRVNDYQITDMGNELSLGTFCHENGHMLCEFPDLYPYEDEKLSGVGSFCLMCGGGNADPKNPTHVNPYLKYRAGWAGSVKTLSAELNAMAQAGTINPELKMTAQAGANQFFIYPNGGSDATEYFIIENRFQAERDVALPGSGLAIWHIDELGDNTGWDKRRRNSECALVQADGRFDLEQRVSEGDTTDLFAAGVMDRFGRTTNPNSNWWDGTASGLEIKNISSAGEEMTFTATNSGNNDDENDEELQEVKRMLTLSHTVKSGETLSQIAAMYGTSVAQISQENDIVAEIADDNDLTGAYLNLNFPAERVTQDWFSQVYDNLYAAASNSDPSEVEMYFGRLEGYLYQCNYEIYQRLLANDTLNPAITKNLHYILHTAQSAWDYFSNANNQWRYELSSLPMVDKETGYQWALYMMGRNQAELTKARIEQLFAAEHLLATAVDKNNS